MIYEAVKLVTAARPNLGFYSCTHSPSHPCAKVICNMQNMHGICRQSYAKQQKM